MLAFLTAVDIDLTWRGLSFLFIFFIFFILELLLCLYPHLYVHITTYLPRPTYFVTVIHLRCYFMLCAFVTYSIKLLLLLLLISINTWICLLWHLSCYIINLITYMKCTVFLSVVKLLYIDISLLLLMTNCVHFTPVYLVWMTL